MTKTHHVCGRCNGKGTYKTPLGTRATCSVCLGLGEYETNDKYKRPDVEEGFTAIHSDIPIEDVIALLPTKETPDE